MELNDEAKLALQIIETTGNNLFLTGKAGTGKTTLLRYLKRNVAKRHVVLAPTGIAAINAEGVTIHSFFQLPFAPFVPDTQLQQAGRYKFSKQKIKMIRSLDLIVIDEISMVRADLLDAVDSVLRHYRRNELPFGGVQLLLIGDLAQLAPVARDEEWQMLSAYYPTPYFFSSRALARTAYSVVELTHVYRQSDPTFIDILNRVRENRADASVLAALNSRCIPGFNPPEHEGYIRLTTHNAQAQHVNNEKLAQLPGPEYKFKAEIEGTFPEMSFPTDETLVLKKDAQVMFVKNDSSPEKRYYNGMIGRICSIGRNGFNVVAKDSEAVIEVTPEEWQNNRYELDPKTKEINEVVEGTFRQFPVKTAWAITIHKSQGLTFSHAIIDASASFAHGQTYVALSRCKSLDGMVLSAPIAARAIIRDASVDAFNADACTRQPNASAVSNMQRLYYLSQVSDLFNFAPVSSSFYSAMRIVTEHYVRTFPKLAAEYKARNAILIKEVMDVAATFKKQYTQLIGQSADYAHDAQLQERIVKGADYFLRKLKELEQLVSGTKLQTDNKELQRRTVDAFNALMEAMQSKHRLLAFVVKSGFNLQTYLRAKALVAIGDVAKVGESGGKKTTRTKVQGFTSSTSTADVAPADINNEAAFDALRAWRKQKSTDIGKPAFCVMTTKSLIDIVNSMPHSIVELGKIKGFGAARAAKYGVEILKVLARVGR